ncbi:MAG: polysaccharide biosynthesis/export family protein [Planctomycetota bacterium]
MMELDNDLGKVDAMSIRGWVGPGLCAVLIGGGLLGCAESDSFIDPSVVGRWEHTPTLVPILEKIDSIESDSGEFVDVSPIMPSDLEARSSAYLLSPGDFVEVTILDFLPGGGPSSFERSVDATGRIDLLQLPSVVVAGLTIPEAEQAIEQVIRDEQILDRPEVSVNALSQRDQTFAIFGAVPTVGRFAVPSPDYRILHALTDAGGVSPVITHVYVIREETFSASGDPIEAERPDRGSDARPIDRPEVPNDSGEEINIIDLIDSIADPPSEEGSELNGMGALGSGVRDSSPSRVVLAQNRGDEPLIDLVDDETPVQSKPEARVELEEVVVPEEVSSIEEAVKPGRWMFIDGQWVKVLQAQPGAGGLPEGADPLAKTDESATFTTQRVIEVPTAPLFQGVANVNIVIRPGDVIRVPQPDQGVVYVSGPGITRPGTYNLPVSGRLTLKRLIAAAGGLSTIAIPERVDITRMVGTDREGTVRVNVRAIAEGTQPDLFVKSDDLVNFGTNFWATPLAVIRGGFRVSYGFGFLLDRNFDEEVFGPRQTAN